MLSSRATKPLGMTVPPGCWLQRCAVFRGGLYAKGVCCARGFCGQGFLLSVIAGLDPAIQDQQRMDARIKSGHDRKKSAE
jgi:hypothetical protein